MRVPLLRRWSFWISMAISAALLHQVADRLVFLSQAERTTALVTGLKPVSHGEYTSFSAQVEFHVGGVKRYATVHAGWKVGPHQDLYKARWQEGELAQVLYNPADPDETYSEGFWDLWGIPFLLLFLQINVLLLVFLQRPRRDAESVLSRELTDRPPSNPRTS